MIVTREITYEVDGLTMIAHLARPSGTGPSPAVLIGHDGIGLEDYQRGRADILAEHGYIALAMDYHAGRTYFGDPQAMLARVMPLLADSTRMHAIGRAALDVLLDVPGVDHDQLAALGYGAGGSIMLELARAKAPFKALAAVHPGVPAAHTEDWTDVRGAFLLCTGSEDPLCTPAQLMEFAGALQKAGADWTVNIYGGAKHAFWADPTELAGSSTGDSAATVPGVGHHALASTRAWQAVLDLLDEVFAAGRVV
ncbi:dienelactone hydrolase family protein [Mycobacterium sp. CPCC 205372]|uniref:Dienelactone hydrolase family protein n=1 Tax=Mycobacterium hippophais TaxID=3016340 RepID=A0ABT4PLI1_9MYCO|nr:dienelactone hydrolase family protein [Mycobacterium hippophais]MCZ8377334.1 dienelactone hydrolase family protein [Mycobacterium hippophais]